MGRWARQICELALAASDHRSSSTCRGASLGAAWASHVRICWAKSRESSRRAAAFAGGRGLTPCEGSELELGPARCVCVCPVLGCAGPGPDGKVDPAQTYHGEHDKLSAPFWRYVAGVPFALICCWVHQIWAIIFSRRREAAN